jgi:DNA-directed RNA polymerase subunit omega
LTSFFFGIICFCSDKAQDRLGHFSFEANRPELNGKTMFCLCLWWRRCAHTAAGAVSKWNCSNTRSFRMARITIEDCQERVDNRFLLVQMAIKRIQQYRQGYEPLVESKNKEVVTALREIAAGKVLPEDMSSYVPIENPDVSFREDDD